MIRVDNLHKSYRIAQRAPGLKAALRALYHRPYTTVAALDGVSFAVDTAEIVGYVGPNGAGKSTTIKILTGVLVPDSGRCEVMGYTPWEDRVAYTRHIGVVFGQRSQLWWDVPVLDSYELLKELYRLPLATFRQNLERLTTLLDLAPLLEVPVRQLSLGQRMRCELAASLLHGPRVLFLDEPTIGLDAVAKLAVRQFIRSINQETQVTVILTTHDMHDIEALADRILLIGRGQILFQGSVAQLRDAYGTGKTITVHYEPSNHPFPELPPGTQVQWQREQAVIQVDTCRATVAQVLNVLSHTVALTDVSIESCSIESILVQLYQEYRI